MTDPLNESPSPTVGPVRRLWLAYGLACAAIVATSAITGHRASRIAGEPLYLFTVTRIPVERRVPPQNATDAAFDALFEEAGEPVKLTVEEPVFVLGMLDAAAPAVLGGLLVVSAATWLIRRRKQRFAPTFHDSQRSGL